MVTLVFAKLQITKSGSFHWLKGLLYFLIDIVCYLRNSLAWYIALITNSMELQ